MLIQKNNNNKDGKDFWRENKNKNCDTQNGQGRKEGKCKEVLSADILHMCNIR